MLPNDEVEDGIDRGDEFVAIGTVGNRDLHFQARQTVRLLSNGLELLQAPFADAEYSVELLAEEGAERCPAVERDRDGAAALEDGDTARESRHRASEGRDGETACARIENRVVREHRKRREARDGRVRLLSSKSEVRNHEGPPKKIVALQVGQSRAFVRQPQMWHARKDRT